MGAGEAVEVDARVGAAFDKYVIVRQLGRGGMGAVYEARHTHLARRFALKFLLPELAGNPEILRRFENEAKAAGGLEHPNLVAVTDVGRTADGAPYLVMEYLEGEDCARLLKRAGPLPVPRAVDIVVQSCRGLAIAHRARIVHRDLKPENLFLTDAGDGCDLVKVLDFGIAKLRGADSSFGTKSGATFGTAYYMSPEQARGAADVDERTDVWSLGVVLYELLAGCKPFDGEQFLEVVHRILSAPPPPLANIRPGLPARLLAAVERAMAKDPAERFPTVASLAEALAPMAIRGSGSGPRTSAPGEETLPTPATGLGVPSERGNLAASTTAKIAHSGLRLVIVLALAVVVGAAAMFFLLRPHQDPPAVTPPVSPPAVVPSPVAAPPPAPVVPAPAPPPAPVRTVSEQSEPTSNRREPPGRRSRKRREAVSVPATPAPIPAAPPAPAGRAIDIETNNPY